jgi:predicted DNA-binding transcriptional regulator AlpA
MPTSTRIPLATPNEVAEHLQKPAKTLAEWRSRGIGPRYLTVGRDVRYRWSDVEEWLATQASDFDAA